MLEQAQETNIALDNIQELSASIVGKQVSAICNIACVYEDIPKALCDVPKLNLILFGLKVSTENDFQETYMGTLWA